MAEVAARTDRDVRIRRLGIGEIQAALRAHNPDTPVTGDPHGCPDRVAGIRHRYRASKAERQEIAREQGQFRAACEEAAQSVGRNHIEDSGEVEHMRGAGLGAILSLEEGRARLEHYASHVPMEEWAGPVAGAGEIEERLGIVRSTLNSWVRQGAVVGLLRGQRKLAYPLEQFVDARPLAGLAEVLRLAPDARSAWLWMRQPHGVLDGSTPLAVLRSGQKERIARIAKRDLARERI